MAAFAQFSVYGYPSANQVSTTCDIDIIRVVCVCIYNDMTAGGGFKD